MAVQAVITTILCWSFLSECSVPDDIDEFLIDGKKAIAAYKHIATVQFSRISASSYGMHRG